MDVTTVSLCRGAGNPSDTGQRSRASDLFFFEALDEESQLKHRSSGMDIGRAAADRRRWFCAFT
jgi:hypothetical protein